MSTGRQDRIKEELAWLRMLFPVGVALDASLAAWLAHNYATAHVVLTTLAIIGIAVVTAVVIKTSYAASRCLNQLENMQ